MQSGKHRSNRLGLILMLTGTVAAITTLVWISGQHSETRDTGVRPSRAQFRDEGEIAIYYEIIAGCLRQSEWGSEDELVRYVSADASCKLARKRLSYELGLTISFPTPGLVLVLEHGANERLGTDLPTWGQQVAGLSEGLGSSCYSEEEMEQAQKRWSELDALLDEDDSAALFCRKGGYLFRSIPGFTRRQN